MNHSASLPSPWAVVCSRRHWLACGAAACAGTKSFGLRHAAAAIGSAPKVRPKSIILLWLNGGPATIDLWDLKPGHANGGPFNEIETAAAGVRISEHLPHLAKRMTDVAVVRSITSKEGDHDRAHHLARTGYTPQGAIRFPALGALLSHEIGASSGDLPAFVSIAPPRYAAQIGGGFLGATASPLVVGLHAAAASDLVVPNLTRAAGLSDEQQHERTALLQALDRGFESGPRDVVVDGLRASRRAALSLMHPDAASAFRLDDEPASNRDRYGRSLFGQGCLLARRLVERGTTFVEVTLDNWDTHADNFVRVKAQSAALDTPFAALLDELRERRLLESTLVLCMGEFGRTPKINVGGGRDHWPHAWSAVLAGGGIRGGQVVGRTDKAGTAVVDRPVRLPDLLATVCRAVGVDPEKQHVSNVGRPIRVVDPLGVPVEELL